MTALRPWITAGTNLESLNWNGDTPLLHAIRCGDDEVVEFLIQNGARVGACDAVGNSSLHLSARTDQDSITKLLIEHGANVNAVTRPKPGGTGRRTPLHLAAGRQFCRTTHLLLQSGALPSAADEWQRTPLHLCARYAERHSLAGVQIAKQLVEAGAKITEGDLSGMTPLHYAAFAGAMEMARFLLWNGADCNATSLEGQKPMIFARDRRMLRLLRKWEEGGKNNFD